MASRIEKVLIVKLGYSETLVDEVGIVSSLGDVLRTTPILHAFKGSDVVWLVDEKAKPLLDGNPFIKRIMVFNLLSLLELQNEKFDIVINFEKIRGVCIFVDSVPADKRYGFGFDATTGSIKSYKIGGGRYWQEVLYEMVERRWNGERYILGYSPKTTPIYDIGLNYAVGTKWPNKAWPMDRWRGLEGLLAKDGYTVSWQRGFDDLYEYMDWINSCRLIITSDSLGLHIAIALSKRIIVLFGPTDSSRIYLYGLGRAVLPKINYECIPCFSPRCRQEQMCMEHIKPEDISAGIGEMLNEEKCRRYS